VAAGAFSESNKNCCAMKKSRAWLDKRGVECAVHDFTGSGVGL
jgi:arsenate reductase-like glutaredoxin family protein